MPVISPLFRLLSHIPYECTGGVFESVPHDFTSRVYVIYDSLMPWHFNDPLVYYL